MAFPSVADQVNSVTTATAASITADLPSYAAGDVVVLLVHTAAAGSISTPSGWTDLIADHHPAVSSGDRVAAFMRTMDGSEGTTVVISSGGTPKWTVVAYTIADGADIATSPPEVTSEATGTSTTPNAPSLAPSGGADDYLWIVFAGQEGINTVSGSVPSYTNTNCDTGTGGSAASNARTMAGYKQANAVSDDPGSWTMSGSEDWFAYTIAFYPSAGAAVTDLNLSAIAAPLVVPTDTLSTTVSFSLSPLAAVTAEPTASLATLVSLALSPIAATPAAPSDTLQTDVSLALSALPAVLAVPTATLSVEGGPTELDLSPIAAATAVPSAALALAVTLQLSPIAAAPSAPTDQLQTSLDVALSALPAVLEVPIASVFEDGVPTTLSLSPIAAVTAVPTATMQTIYDLTLSAIATQLDVPLADLQLSVALNLSAIAATLSVPVSEICDTSGASGSDAEFIADCVAYYLAYDLLGDDEVAKRALLRNFMLSHGGRVVWDHGFYTIVGAALPVRIEGC